MTERPAFASRSGSRAGTMALLLLAFAAGPALARQQNATPQSGPSQPAATTPAQAPTGDAVAFSTYRRPGPDSPKSADDVVLYMQETKTAGRITIPDPALATLVQPEGRDWRVFKTRTAKWVAGIAILGMAAALLLFFLVRGRIRIDGGRSGRTVPRFTGIERFTHWLTAVSFLSLAVTGLIVTFGRPLLLPLIGHPAFTALSEVTKYVHNFSGVPFVVGILLMIVLWVRDNIPGRGDLDWFREMGGLFRSTSTHPVSKTGRFNAGQKGVFWAVVIGGLALAVSGTLLMVPFWLTGIGGMQVAHVVHAVLAALMVAGILAHIYIGSVGMEGAFEAMGRGEVDENWAREHHRGWYEALRRRRPGSGPGGGRGPGAGIGVYRTRPQPRPQGQGQGAD